MSLASSDNLFFLPLSSSASTDHSGNDGFGGRPRFPDQFVGDQSNLSLQIFSDLNQFPDHFWPVVLTGPCGSGKTTLARSTIERWIRLQESCGHDVAYIPKALVVTANDFVRGMLEAIQTKSVSSYLDRILSHAGVVFDDIDEIANYKKFQPDLVTLLDQFLELKRPVMITSKQSLDSSQDGKIISQLSSRLSGGLTLPVSLPGREARLHLLEWLTKRHAVPLEREQIESLAAKYPLSLPRLNQIVLETKNRISVGAAPVDDSRVNRSDLSRIYKIIVDMVAKQFELDGSLLTSSSRKQTVVMGRGICVYLAREALSASYSSIGLYFGGRDHSTTMHAYRTTADRIANDPALKLMVDGLIVQLHDLASLPNIDVDSFSFASCSGEMRGTQT
ncbi:MAG: helix-turn-helix domain-containing protein [Pirellulaceae bacterium]